MHTWAAARNSDQGSHAMVAFQDAPATVSWPREWVVGGTQVVWGGWVGKNGAGIGAERRYVKGRGKGAVSSSSNSIYILIHLLESNWYIGQSRPIGEAAAYPRVRE